MRVWNINTRPGTAEEAPTLDINLIDIDSAHVVRVEALATLPASEIAAVLAHMEATADQYAATKEVRMRGTLSGSLSVTAADGTDITQPPEVPQPPPNA